MKFGSVNNPREIDFSLPEDHPETANVLLRTQNSGKPTLYVGCAKWNRGDLKNFYPRGTKDELTYYATQFNAIELNATFYRNYSEGQVRSWAGKVPEHFRFFPKVNREVSHRKWLEDVKNVTQYFLSSVSNFEEKLGTIFLQLHNNFAPKYFDRVSDFIESWPNEFPLAIEFRHTGWYNDPEIAAKLYRLLEDNDIANVIVDTAGRRDLLHLRLTNNVAFIRYVGANHPTDYSRLDDWVHRLKAWAEQGLENIYFFVHQNEEQESPRLGAYFIHKMNQALGIDLTVPNTQNELF
ncbi:MAG: DUF72 domain-containing protein [Balneolaceae bacterium]|jgi:uncharacterized protein YecE (DUF72 family)